MTEEVSYGVVFGRKDKPALDKPVSETAEPHVKARVTTAESVSR